MPSHTHTGTADSAGEHTHGYTGINAGAIIASPGSAGAAGAATTGSVGAHTHTVTNANTGGDGAHNNTQPTLVLNHIIKS